MSAVLPDEAVLAASGGAGAAAAAATTPAAGPDIRAGRLPADVLAKHFADAHPALSRHQAAVEADRCLYCHDAPCVTACPTAIPVPEFIHRIATGNVIGAARDILDANAMGAMCARVCPTEVLCEGACVRNSPEDRPVAIGALQRFATDVVFERELQLFTRAAPTGQRVAVVGGGPAGLACAHRLARAGHDVTVFDARDKLGGLNEYGIAAYKVAGRIPQREVDWLLALGGITARTGQQLGRDFTLAGLRRDFDAVFLGLGLGAVNALGVADESVDGVVDAVAYIARLRQAADLATLPVGRRVVVIGGGMTAIDIATQSKRLGADEVTIVYRRGPAQMGASDKEQRWAQVNGVTIRHFAQPARLTVTNGAVTAITFETTRVRDDGTLVGTGEHFTLAADMVFKAVGQTLVPDDVGGGEGGHALLDLDGGRLRVDAQRRTSLRGVWAGGDCVAGGPDLTVAAVDDGQRAAASIDAWLRETMTDG
jgi:glutamate synthase (NADPH/NADH) small chain